MNHGGPLRILAIVIGLVTAALGIAGLVLPGERLFGVIDADLLPDIARLVVGAALLIASFAPLPLDAVRSVLVFDGALCLLMALRAAFDRSMGGLLPTGFTGFDLALHVVVGACLIAVCYLPWLQREGETEQHARR
jgi:hypothetical protein